MLRLRGDGDDAGVHESGAGVKKIKRPLKQRYTCSQFDGNGAIRILAVDHLDAAEKFYATIDWDLSQIGASLGDINCIGDVLVIKPSGKKVIVTTEAVAILTFNAIRTRSV